MIKGGRKMKSQKIHNAQGKLVGIVYVDDNGFRIEIVKDRCKTIIIHKNNGDIKVQSVFIDRI